MKYTYDENIEAAKKCPWRIHWIVGTMLVMVGLLLENPTILLQEIIHEPFIVFLYATLGGVVTSAISWLLMLFIPAPYAKLYRVAEQYEANRHQTY